MNDIIFKTKQTPIEIALGIDEDGMTTAGRLFDFFGMDRSHYARWFKNNITNNQFAEENIDYFPFATNGECGGQASKDAKLTATFAKKLSMQQKNKRGEEARQYFIGIESKAVDMAHMLQELKDNPMKVLELHYKALKEVDEKVTKTEGKIEELGNKLDSALLELPLLGVESDKINGALKKRGMEIAGGKDSNAYKDKRLLKRIYWDMHGQLRREFGVNTYKAIKRNQTELALKFLSEYKPPLILKNQIDQCNAQLSLHLEGGVSK